MGFRYCIYKKCGNYVDIRNRTSNDVKLFGFPKNPERRKKWFELGQVPENLPESVFYFCSDHFDKKFLAINNRRTVLVGEALPFPYVETENDEPNRDEDFNFLIYDFDKSNNADKQSYTNDQDIVVESTTISTDIQDNLDEQQYDNSENKEEPEEYIIFSDDDCSKGEPAAYNTNKRKLDAELIQTTISKPKVLKTSQVQKPLQKSSEECDNMKPISNVYQNKNIFSSKGSCEDNMNSSELVDAKHVTTFIFKGQEYVQMPKDYYLSEKIGLMKTMQKMEQALRAIKGHLSTLEGI